MVSVLEYDLRDTADLGRKWLIDFNDDILISIVIYCFVWPANNSCAIDVKMNVSLGKLPFKMLGLSFSFKLD